MMTTNIMIVGVGGQGTLLASRILGNVAIKQGYDVKVSEVHGMSQRGGSVVTYVKYGKEVNSPIIDLGEADIILAFEKLESIRALPFLKIGGKIILNNREIAPMPVITGACEYPQGIVEELSSKTDVIALDALDLSLQAGSPKAVNVVLIGVLAKSTNIDKQVWLDVIKETVPSKFLELNLKAFELGYNFSI
ncbi:MAG: indolepyruvate oxidoreductase subunit beta [Clostridia bacterium]|nr:indolepyruvate oxidoreductase subunit beta [Clostridia bacterium]